MATTNEYIEYVCEQIKGTGEIINGRVDRASDEKIGLNLFDF